MGYQAAEKALARFYQLYMKRPMPESRDNPAKEDLVEIQAGIEALKNNQNSISSIKSRNSNKENIPEADSQISLNVSDGKAVEKKTVTKRKRSDSFKSDSENASKKKKIFLQVANKQKIEREKRVLKRKSSVESADSGPRSLKTISASDQTPAETKHEKVVEEVIIPTTSQGKSKSVSVKLEKGLKPYLEKYNEKMVRRFPDVKRTPEEQAKRERNTWAARVSRARAHLRRIEAAAKLKKMKKELKRMK